MRLSLLPLLAAVLLGTTIGCGGSSTPASSGAAATGAATADAVATTPGIPADPIAKVVYEFLDAVRRGDTQAASQRLTPLALQKTSEMDFVFAPPGSATARFEVGAAELVEKDKAVVDSVWTDLDADGNPQREPTLWALRFADGQWRVSGMVADMGEGQPPLVIDFENPATMAPQQPVDPNRVVDGRAAPATEQPASEVARNPFEPSAQR
ncbi:MAG: hypothetical protein DCC67_06820 [Planctomycetota bacterium]|nr:MAG: hypothetical protein DCC67_06820 [Planctomycetota bacterium]